MIMTMRLCKSNVIQRCLHSYRQDIVLLVSPQQILTQRKRKRCLNLSRNPIGLFPKMVREQRPDSYRQRT